MKASELRAKKPEELQKLLATARTDLLEAQKSLAANELANPHAVKKLRHSIARIKTVMTEQASPSHPELDSGSSKENSNNDKKGKE